MMAEVEVSSRRERKKSATRARIIEAATELFERQGYRATSIEEITDVADVAPRIFYSYFDAKVDVAIVQLESWVDELIAALRARPDSETPDQMYVGALDDLGSRDFVTGQRPRDGSGRLFTRWGWGFCWPSPSPRWQAGSARCWSSCRPR